MATWNLPFFFLILLMAILASLRSSLSGQTKTGFLVFQEQQI